MANLKGNEAALRETRYKAAWRSGSTRTIRVPVVLAEAVLEYAHQLDSGVQQHDTMNNSSFDLKESSTQSIDTSDSSDKVKQLKDEIERLQNKLGNLLKQNELPDAADLLNRLKAKRKKSTASLADVEALLEMIEG